MATKNVTVPNISCGHCVKTIMREMEELDGIRSISADEASQEVTVEWDEATRSWDDIRDFLAEINYPPAEG